MPAPMTTQSARDGVPFMSLLRTHAVLDCTVRNTQHNA
jgi:hypothetical protein